MKHLEVRSGVYRDSVRLMQISSILTRLPGVADSLVAMATPLNLDLVERLGFARPDAGPNDLVVAVVATSPDALATATDQLEVELAGMAGPQPSVVDVVPRTTASAVTAAGANLVLVSTPGRYAFVEAMDALDSGASVMIFSDHVPLAQEVALKRFAAQRGLLVLGPDCGTAIVSGVGLGFANVVPPGPVGLVAASGTGAQQVLSLLSWAGVGISHCLGVGGRDLSTEVGGASTLAALELLDADPATSLIIVVGKRAEPEVAVLVAARAAELATPVVLGWSDLTGTAEQALHRLGRAVPQWPAWGAGAPRAGFLCGLFSGGTLCVEALDIARAALGPVRSNVDRAEAGQSGHILLDLGADEFTGGRPHPIIDPTPRLTRLAGCTSGVLLLDVVLGHGAHPDPAGILAAAIADAVSQREVSVVVTLVGTRDDPQGFAEQAARLAGAGAAVFTSNAAAARHAVSLLSGGSA